MEKSIAELEYQIETLTRRNSELEASLKKETARADNEHAGRHIAVAAARAGVRPGAIEDAVLRAVSAGQWKADKSGRITRYSADGFLELVDGEIVTPQRAVEALREKADHLWPDAPEANQGAPQQAPAAQQGKPKTAYTGDNPWIKGKATWNFTKQVAIKQADPALAESLERAAKEINQTVSRGSSLGIPASRLRG
jgi:cell division septum initiation protein DivIVA